MRWTFFLLVVVISVLLIPGALAAAPAADENAQANEQDAPDDGRPAPRRIRFNFKEASFEQVVEFFSRETGLPVIWEADPPEGALNYLSPDSYEMREALRVLNIILQSRGVMLRVSDDMLYFRKLEDMKRADVPTYIGEVPSDVTPDQIITVVRQLDNALARPMAERLAGLVAEYGSVAPMEQQNAIVLTETAGQVRRLLSIIEALDREDPEGVVEIFRVKHTRARDLMEPLKALLSVRVERFIIDQRGEQKRIEEDEMQGLNISHDDRTNAIIARGTQSRINNLRESIELLDVPTTASPRAIQTVTLAVLSPRDAEQRLNQIFNRLDEDRRPTVIRLDEMGQITMVGDERAIADGLALLREIDGGDADPAAIDTDRRMSVVVLEHAEPDGIIAAMRGLLNNRQLASTRIVAGPDGKSIILAGPARDVQQVESIIPALDRERIVEESEVRTYSVRHGDLERIARTLRELADAGALSPAARARGARITVTTEPASRKLIVSGPVGAFERVEEMLDELDAQPIVPATTLRFIRLEHARAESVAGMLQDVLRTRLREEVPDIDPAADVRDLLKITADRKTNTLIISAPAALIPVAEELIRHLDDSTVSIGEPIVRVVPLTFADANDVSRALQQASREMISSVTGERMNVRLTPSTGSNALIIVGLDDDLEKLAPLIESLDERPTLDALDAKTYVLEHGDAENLAPIIQRLLSDQIATDPWVIRERVRRLGGRIDFTPQIRVEADTRTNSVIVSAPQRILVLAETLIQQLDRPDDEIDRIFDTFTPANARPDQLARTAERIVRSTLPAGKRSTLEVFADQQSGAIIVVGAEDEADDALRLLRRLDEETLIAPQMDFRIVELDHSDAGVVARALGPMLQDQARWPRTLQTAIQRGVRLTQPTIHADDASNRLLISAPKDLMPLAHQLVRELDQARLDDAAIDVRIFPLEQADAAQVASAVREALQAKIADTPGRKRLAVTAEPSSNSIIVTAAPALLEEVEAIIRPLDRGVMVDQAQVRTVFLKHARAEQVAPIVRELLSGEEIPFWARLDVMRRGQRMPETGPDVRVSADRRLNAVVIAAPPSALDVAEQMVVQLDVDPKEIDGTRSRTVRVLSVHNADARELASNLQGIFDEPDHAEAPPTIRVDAASNSLLVRATPEQFATIEEVVHRIDRATIATARQMQMIRIDPAKGSAEDIARTLKRLIDRSEGSRVEVISIEELMERREQRDVAPRGSSRLDETSSRPNVQTAKTSYHREPRRATEGEQSASDRLSRSSGHQDNSFASWSSVAISGESHLDIWTLPVALAAVNTHWLAASPESPEDDSELLALLDDGADVTIAIDAASNSLIVIGSQRAVDRVRALAQQVQDHLPAELGTVRYIALPDVMDVRSLAQLLNQTLAQMTPPGGQRGDYRRRVGIIPDVANNALIVTATDHDFEHIGDLIAAMSRPETRDFDVRTIVLERASADAVADAVQRFYDDRARIASRVRGRRDVTRRVSIIGHEQSRTLLISASDDDFEQIRELIEQFDSPEATRALEFRVFQLQHAKARDIRDTVQGLASDLIWGQGPVFWSPQGMRGARDRQDTVAVRADERLNALIVTGEGDRFAIVESLIEVLDAPVSPEAQQVVRIYPVQHARVNVLADLLRETFTDPTRAQRRWWEPPDPSEMRIRSDEATRTLIVSATEAEHKDVAAMIESIEDQLIAPDVQTRVLPVEFAQASELAGTLQRFLRDRARATGAPEPSAAIIPSETANKLLVSAEDDAMATIRDLLAQLDQPDVSGDRAIEIIVLQEGEAQDVARIVRQQFSAPGARRAAGRGVIVTPDVRTNSLIINAPRQQFAQVEALINRLDSPSASDETIIRTYALDGARAQEAQRILAETLQLDARGRTPGRGISIKLEDSDSPAVEVTARIVADRRSNSLIVTATEQSFPVIEQLIRQIDDVPSRSPVEYRVVRLEFALADDVAFTLRQMARGFPRDDHEPRIDYNAIENQLIISATSDQFEQINRILTEVDKPSERRRVTEFVPLEFAEAEQVREALSMFYGRFALEADTPGKRNVRIVADPATNSLVISAEADEWEGIRSLLAELDSEEYDASLQLRVLPLTFADAQSVARAINDAFSGTIERRRDLGRIPQRRQQQRDLDPRDIEMPTMLVESEEWVRASAEPLTNSVIVSASRQNIRKIEAIVDQLDVADYAKLPAPRLIPVRAGNPEQLAQSLRRLYEPIDERRGRDALRIVADASSNTVIVRADEEEFQQLSALAEALQQEAGEQGVTVRVLRLQAAPAPRVAGAIRDAYRAKAQQANQPLSIQVDSQSNALVIASTGSLFREIEQTVEQLDALSPGTGQGIFIIELENVAPEEAKRVIESIGLHRSQPDDSVSRLVSEPITVAVLQGRNALIVVGNPADRETIVGLLKAVDAEPDMAEATMRVVRLRNAEAQAVVRILQDVLAPADQQTRTALARAIQEQVRRLAVRRDGLNEQDLHLDLTKPIRLIADANLNAIVISSTPPNVAALEQIAKMFDTLPVTDAVTVQLFPLQNIAADQFSRIVRDLFEQGKRLDRVPGTDLTGLPKGMVGKALLDEIAMTTDERTNTVIVAGKEDTVALVEVLSKRLDSDIATGWVEPRIVPLRHADAGNLAEMLRSILIDGAADLPQATPIQQQVGRLRIARQDDRDERVIESDVFQPMTRLVIRPDQQLNALVLVGTPGNIQIVTELVSMLDIEAASPSAAVRIYPVEHASASRLAQTITRLFDQQVESKAIRPEDRVIVQPDERTNALIVTTSARSFAVLESLLSSLDQEIGPDLRDIRRIDLTNASATRLAGLVQQMMDARLERLRRVQPETAELERATIIAEPRTNSLIIAASNESFEVIQRLTAELDNTTLAEQADIHVIPIVKGNLDRIADAINQIMDRRYADQPAEVRQTQKPLVMTDPRTNSLLVAANAEDLQSIETLVERLGEAPISPAVGVHVVQLDSSTSAAQLAPRLQRLMRERQQTLGDARTPSDQVSIEADPGSNSLIIAANEENYDVIRSLINVLVKADEDTAIGREVDLIMITSGRATEMVNLLNDLHVREANRARGEETVRVTADERLNAVLVNAPAADVRIIRDLVGRLDGAKPAMVIETKFIPLESANALETVSLIENVLSGRGIGTGARGTPQSTVLKYVRQIARDRLGDKVIPDDPEELTAEMIVGAAIRESITLTPDVRTNTVIVSAPSDSMRLIERMVRDLDASSIGSQTIRIFELVNADAMVMAQILTDLFSLRRQGNLFVLRPREGPGAVVNGLEAIDRPSIPAMGDIELTAVPDERQQLAITVDSRTNSLLVSGTPTYLDLVESVVTELDRKEASERETIVYPLRNAEAEEVARVVSQFIDREQEKLISTLGTEQIGSAARLMEREITIVGDEKSNTVLVSASPRYRQSVLDMIDQLDVDPPQVLIQVMLAEVTLDDSFDWGVDFEAVGRVGAATVTGGYGLASAFVTNLGVPNIAVASSDFDLLIRAMTAQGRLQVLSNPSVMAANNEEARIQVGETIRLPMDVSVTDAGRITSTVEAEEIGVILNVRPSINPDGFVRMEINPEISNLSARTTRISEDFEAPIITRRTANTTVTVFDGQTIVIGGLISDRFERRDHKVPLLGDIPILGALFRAQQQEQTHTELLIVLTPHVIESPAELHRVRELTDREIDRLTVPEDVREGIRRSVEPWRE